MIFHVFFLFLFSILLSYQDKNKNHPKWWFCAYQKAKSPSCLSQVKRSLLYRQFYWLWFIAYQTFPLIQWFFGSLPITVAGPHRNYIGFLI